jgi:hypothetical protein
VQALILVDALAELDSERRKLAELEAVAQTS